MRIRVEGTRAEVDAAVAWLVQVLDVQETSEFYPNRGASRLGRVYLTIAVPDGRPPRRAPSERADRPDSSRPQLPQARQIANRITDQKRGPA